VLVYEGGATKSTLFAWKNGCAKCRGAFTAFFASTSCGTKEGETSMC
jgi:hypothetical protein